MEQIEQGKKGFQSLPKDKHKTARGLYYLTPTEMKHFKAFCQHNNTTPSEWVRLMIQSEIGTFKYDSDHNPNQLRIE